MSNIALAAKRIIGDKLLSQTIQASRSNEISRNIAIVAGLTATVGLSFLIFSAHLWLQKNYQADMAAAITGMLSMGIGGTLALVALFIVHVRQKVTRKLKHEIQDLLHDLIESVDEILTDPVRKSPKTSALLAVIAGFVIGGKVL